MLSWPIKLAVVVASVVGLSGCAHTRVAYRHPSFTGPALAAGGIAVAAVTARGQGEFEQDRDAAETVQERLQARRPGLRIVPLSEVLRRFEPQHYAALLKALDETNVWTARDFEPFNQLSNQVRYLLFVELLDRDLTRGEYHSSLWNGSESAFDEYASREWLGFENLKYSILTARASFLVYDLARQRPVWEIQGWARIRVVNSAVSQFYVPEAPWPGIPDVVGGLDRITQYVARKLPQ